MSFNLSKYKNNFLFIPLGGSSEIGINVNLYHLDGKWIMVDCGSGFADDNLPGVDMVVADLSFIEKHKDDLLGIIITHSHEDHLGAIQYLWGNLGCPIYTTEYTKNFLELKLAEYNFDSSFKINALEADARFDLGPFSIEITQLAHSAPEMQALMIRTRAGNILHTGDWKFDHTPVIGEKADEEKLKRFGDEGVLALVCDSTNVFNEGFSGSEGEVRDSLVDIISGCPEMVVVTTFASNLARLDSIMHAAQKAGRKIAMIGRSLHRVFEAARKSGYLQDISIIDEKSMSKHRRKELLVIATGCQGEPMAAAAKLSNNSHHTVKLAPKDTIIFSSKIIPGNEKKIFAMFNKFVKSGVEVITEKDHFVHVSGHPSIEELKKMYKLVRPKICIPVHGEPVHIHGQVKLAKSEGIKHTIEVENGSVVLLDHPNPSVIDKVETGYFAVDGNYLLPDNSIIFKIRRKLSQAGIVFVSLVVSTKAELLADPKITAPGLLDDNDDYDLLQDMRDEIIEVHNNLKFQTGGKATPDQIEGAVRSTIKRLIKSEISKSPLIKIHVEEIA